MIRIEKIHIHEFRGIRDLILELNGKNFAACGPNGTGKSGIVDAIEFAFTGNISRLSGSGTGGLSVKQHGPHVDSRDKPEQAFVEIEVSIPSLANKKATIRRTVKSVGVPKITPADPDVLTVFAAVALHPEFVLSRREIIRYVLSEPGQRSKEVQALLRLESIEKLRTVINKISNSSAKEVVPLERAQRESAAQLQAALSVSQLTAARIVDVTNANRALLGLPAIVTLEPQTSLKDGLASSAAGAASKLPKTQALADIQELDAALKVVAEQSFSEACSTVKAEVQELNKDPDSADNVTREEVLQSSLELFDGENCPVCDTKWERRKFEEHVAAKLEHLSVITEKRKTIEAQLKPVIESLDRVRAAIDLVRRYALLLNPQVDAASLITASTELRARIEVLANVLPLSECEKALEEATTIPGIAAAIEAIKAGVNAIPEPTKQDGARDFLVVGQERLEAYRKASMQLKSARERAERSASVLKIFGESTTKALENIYKNVEAEFTECYRRINQSDEGGFTAKLIPSIGKLGFDVDFYGRGHFPPGAYHSEGHQDGMGLCLYLALMRHLLGSGFNFAVLDDVLMSVDVGHRREVCDLLKEKFPGTQFIFTTHDEIWLRHMKSAGLIRPGGFVHFRTWAVDTGPTDWDSHDVWAEIDAELKLNNVRGAAAVLRHYLEHFSAEACDRLRARVEFRGDAQFVLGDLLPGAISAMGDSIKRGKAAANSWDQKSVVAALGAQGNEFAVLYEVTGVDQWQVNAAVHYNQWANLQKNDFMPVVSAFKALTDAFLCADCDGMLSVTPDRGPKEALRCPCGKTNINLVPKQK